MLKKLLKWLAVFLTAFAAVVAALLFVPKNNGKPYRITVAKNQGISSVSRKLGHAMNREGFHIGRDKTARLMKLIVVTGVRPRRRPETPASFIRRAVLSRPI